MKTKNGDPSRALCADTPAGLSTKKNQEVISTVLNISYIINIVNSVASGSQTSTECRQKQSAV